MSSKSRRRRASVRLSVTIPAGMTDATAARLLGDILRVGQADAASTAADPDSTSADAIGAAALRFGKPHISEGPP